MVVLSFAIVLAVISVATFPCWPYSMRWSHVPSTIAGILLLCVAVAAVSGRSSPKAPETDVEVASASPASSIQTALHRAPGLDGSAPEGAFP